VALKIRSYAGTPAPLKIATTPGAHHQHGVALRMTREVVFFESLFRPTSGPGSSAGCSTALLLVLLRHVRYFRSRCGASDRLRAALWHLRRIRHGGRAGGPVGAALVW
jgi:hypothetical protein